MALEQRFRELLDVKWAWFWWQGRQGRQEGQARQAGASLCWRRAGHLEQPWTPSWRRKNDFGALGRQVGSGATVSETLGSQVGPGTAILRILSCFLTIFGSFAKPANPLKYRACRQKQRFSPLRCELSRWRAAPSKNEENTSVSGTRGRQVGSAMAILGAFGHQVGSGTTVSGALGSSWPWFWCKAGVEGVLEGLFPISLALRAPLDPKPLAQTSE